MNSPIDLDDREHLSPTDALLISKTLRTVRARPEELPRPRDASQVERVGEGIRPSAPAMVSPAVNVIASLGGGYDRQAEMLDVGVRLRYFAAPSAQTLFLDYLDGFVEDCVAFYEARGPAALMPLVARQRKGVQALVEGWQLPRDRIRLLRSAGRLSGLAGYMAVNLGDFRLARAYCVEAFTLALAVEDSDLAAWVRGTESLCAYYAGDYRLALERAREGQIYAAGGPQAIRLAVNGEARALGQLGDRDGVHEAVGRAFDLAEGAELPDGMSPCISFGSYSLARIAANAATAHVGTGETALVQRYAQTASSMPGADRSRWSDVLITLDVATALTAGADPDPEHSAALGVGALTRAGTAPIESIRQRGRELARRTAPWWTLPAVAELAEVSQTLAHGAPR
ncbi:transcriptional regulator [Frankia sp. CiP3]|uniref:transcriptional regulator n=1 Tax=Frankia sp. CiP3 TaxID=2880971 RepID=UPI001EF64930|nr:transcriptional regulator [Frankia sp. CiP3]